MECNLSSIKDMERPVCIEHHILWLKMKILKKQQQSGILSLSATYIYILANMPLFDMRYVYSFIHFSYLCPGQKHVLNNLVLQITQNHHIRAFALKQSFSWPELHIAALKLMTLGAEIHFKSPCPSLDNMFISIDQAIGT